MTSSPAGDVRVVTAAEMYEHYRLARLLSWQHAALLALIGGFGLLAGHSTTFHIALLAAAVGFGLAGRLALSPPTLTKLKLVTVLRMALLALLLVLPAPDTTAAVVALTTMSLIAFTWLLSGPRSNDV